MHPSIHRIRRRAALAWLAGATAGAQAAPGGLPTNVGHADSSPEWDKLRDKLFPGRKLQTQDAKIKLIVPLRAAYGASVPVKIQSLLPQRPDLYVRRMTLLVDKNPSPVAAVLDLSPGLGQADFETRLRVDEYSHIRVIAELSNGEFHTDSRYVKVSGGCSAPPNRELVALMGKTMFKLPDAVKLNQPNPVELVVLHPNDTGFELNQVTVMYIPPHFVRSIKVSYEGQKMFDAELDFSISENPNFRFHFVPQGPGTLHAEVVDSKDQRYQGSLAVTKLDQADH
jgi:sulfur-oxidizing protein SoxY